MSVFQGHSHACYISYIHGQLNAITIVLGGSGICMLPRRFLKKQLQHHRMRFIIQIINHSKCISYLIHSLVSLILLLSHIYCKKQNFSLNLICVHSEIEWIMIILAWSYYVISSYMWCNHHVHHDEDYKYDELCV